MLWVSKLGRQRERWWWPLAQEAYQPLNVLRSRSQVVRERTSIFANAATKSDLILEFRKQSLCFFLLSLRIDEGGGVDQASSALPGRLVPVDGKILQR